MNFEVMNQAVQVSGDTKNLMIKAPEKTDFFIDPCSDYRTLNAPYYYTEVEGDFIFGCRVRPEFIDMLDAGCVIAYESDDRSIKMAFEKTGVERTAITTTVTDKTADDSIGERIQADEIYLQIIRKNDTWVLHYSLDGESWHVVRCFILGLSQKIKVGVMAQSPAGNGCSVLFKDIEVRDNIYRDIRNINSQV